MGKANIEIRMLLFRTRLKQKDVARKCGVNQYTMSKWLSSELTERRKERILKAVVDLVMERGEIREEPLPLK